MHATKAIQLALAIMGSAMLATPARADLQLCSRMSYVVEAAIGDRGQGRGRDPRLVPVDPGQCRTVLQGALPGRAGSMSMPGRSRSMAARRCRSRAHADFCVATENFCSLAAARTAPRPASRSPASPQVKPSESEKGLDRLSRRGGRIHRRAGARRRHPAPAGDRRLRRQSDRRHPRRQDRRALVAVHADNKLERHRGRPLGLLRRADRRGAEAGRRRLRLVQRDAAYA